MATTSSGHKKQREIIPNRPNQVISVTEVKLVAFRFTDGDGNVDTTVAICGGKDSEDGGIGVLAIDARDFQRGIVIPTPYVKKGIRALLAEQNKAPVLESPEGLELGDGEMP